jgi:hypothetical protein
MADGDFTLIKAMAVAAFYCGLKADKIIHANYSVPIEASLLIVFHELVALFLIMGVFFQTRPYIVFHLVVAAFVFCLWFALGRNCILTLMKRQLIPYTEKDYELIYGSDKEKVTTFVSVVGVSLAVSAYKLLFGH